MHMLKQLYRNRWLFRALIPSIIFNFRNLPFSKAYKIPILLYKAKIMNTSGSIIINAPIKFGMIRFGENKVSLFPNNGIIFENRGEIVFNGKTFVGNNSAISLGKSGKLEFGNNFNATTGLKIACYNSIIFEDNVLIGWNTQIVDTDFHALKNIENTNKTKGYGKVHIGHDVWIANGCRIYKNVVIPPLCVVGADTILHSSINCLPYSLITNEISIKIQTNGFYHDNFDDKINYPSL